MEPFSPPGPGRPAMPPAMASAFPHVLGAPRIRAHRSEARVRLFNVKYSPNLGDGLLAECLEQALVECGTSADTWSVDLAGRSGRDRAPSPRAASLRLLAAMPGPLRRLCVRLPLAIQTRHAWRPHFRRALDGADCVVIGGGNLLTDLDLNFPTKLAVAVDEAHRRNLPVFLYACGVSDNWSAAGRRLLHRALDTGGIRQVFVRDERSRRIWNDLAGRSRNLPAMLVRDPGLLAASLLSDAPFPAQRPARSIGINVTSALALHYHAAAGGPVAPSAAALAEWYLRLARALLARGHAVAVFTNGSPEDRASLDRMRPAFAALGRGDRISFPDPRSPVQLVDTIAALGGLVAYRMHAVIAAYACGVPFTALDWDPKLEAFLHSVDRAAWLCRPARTEPEIAAAMLDRAIDEGIPADERDRVVIQARRGVAMLHDAMARVIAR